MKPETVFYLVFVFAACSMMIINIIIGWTAVRNASKTPDGYTNKMFILELLIVACFFAMNNVIMFSFGGSLAITDTAGVKMVMQNGIDIAHIAITAASLYVLTAVFLVLCKLWNFEFYKVSKKVGFAVYERMLWLIIVLCIALAATSVSLRTQLETQVACFIAWLLAWAYINWHWIASDELL
jgi:hypothetical protein